MEQMEPEPASETELEPEPASETEPESEPEPEPEIDPQVASAEACQAGAALLFNAACSADFAAAAAKFDHALRLYSENDQARRFLTLASELDLETRIANFFITHQHTSNVEKLTEAAEALAREQIAIGSSALEAAEDTKHLVVATEYFKAALRLAPMDDQAAELLEDAGRRLFESRAPVEEMAPPYRSEDVGKILVHSVRVTRGLQQSDRSGALFVAYEVTCEHSMSTGGASPDPRLRGAEVPAAVEAEAPGTEAVVCGEGEETSLHVYPTTDGTSQVIGSLWRGDRVRVIGGVDCIGDSAGWCRIAEDGRWSSSPSSQAWVRSRGLHRRLGRMHSPVGQSSETLRPEVLVQLDGRRAKHTVYCRYSAFEQLRKLLAASLPDGDTQLPPLPRKTLSFHAGVGDSSFVERRRQELDLFLQGMLVVPAASTGLFAAGSKDRSMWGNGLRGRGGPPLCHHHGLTFLGLLPGQRSHRQPVAPPPYAEGEQHSARIVSIDVLRGLQEDGYVDYEICTRHVPAKAAPGTPQLTSPPPHRSGGAAAGWVGPAAAELPGNSAAADSSSFYSYCRYSKFERCAPNLNLHILGPRC
jgi:hypothetical protein